jgi:hypothetical protein
MKKVTTPYFPAGLRYSTPLFFAAALLLMDYPVWCVILLLTGVIVLTTHYGTQIDLTKKVYTDYLSFLGLKLNPETGKFDRVIKIVITKGNYKQHVQSRIQSRTMAWSDYTGTLVFSGDHTLDLLTDLDKKKLIKRLKEFAVFLKIDVEDCTTSNPYWIDLDKY